MNTVEVILINLSAIYLFILILQSNITTIITMWPPLYKVNLEQHEEFIIGEYDALSLNDDYNINHEDEMIKSDEIKQFNLNSDLDHFDRLHRIVKRFNEKEKDDDKYFIEDAMFDKYENYSDLLEPEPFQFGFVDKDNKFINNEDTFYINNKTKILESIKLKEKRDDTNEDDDYNYEELHKEYHGLIDKEKKSNITFNSTSYDEHESVQDAFGKIVDFKSTPRNCTEEELNGIGFGAAKCIWLDLNKSETRESKIALLHRIKRVFIIWFCVYLLIVIPCWCQKGWCCCCCCCKFCKPLQQIDEAKRYFMNNPPGLYFTEKKEVIQYDPSTYEIDAYNKLEKTLMTI